MPGKLLLHLHFSLLNFENKHLKRHVNQFSALLVTQNHETKTTFIH